MRLISRLGWLPSLRARLFLGMLSVTFTATIGFALAMHEFVNVLEDELLNQTLARELDSLAIDYRNHAPIAGDRGKSGHVYVVSPHGSRAAIPAPLATLSNTQHRKVRIAGDQYYAGRRDVDGAAIYFLIDVDAVEHLEHRLAVIGWATLAGAVLVSLLLSIVFSYLILRPVRALSGRLSAYHPGQTTRPIAQEYADRDIRLIAQSFDALIARFDDFISREQAFTEDAGHELRTPLAVALSSNELLLASPGLDPKTRQRAERTRAACERMQRLVSALLFLARTRDEQQQEECDVARVLVDVLPYYSRKIRNKGIDLKVVSHSAPVRAPEGIVDCVLHNLLENAVEHTVTGSVQVYVGPQRIEVRDTGHGIEHQALQHLFDRRYRCAESRGLGIGLYLVQRICTRLGWRISVESDRENGTIFLIELN